MRPPTINQVVVEETPDPTTADPNVRQPGESVSDWMNRRREAKKGMEFDEPTPEEKQGQKSRRGGGGGTPSNWDEYVNAPSGSKEHKKTVRLLYKIEGWKENKRRRLRTYN